MCPTPKSQWNSKYKSSPNLLQVKARRQNSESKQKGENSLDDTPRMNKLLMASTIAFLGFPRLFLNDSFLK